MIIKRVKKCIDRADIVSFDIYDTLIYRMVSPEVVFQLVQDNYNNIENNKICDFVNIRKDVEKELRKENCHKEVTFNQIYDRLKNKLSNYNVDLLKEIELEIEFECTYFNNKIYGIYEYCKKKSKKIIITSDMYMSLEFIQKVLKKNNIEYSEIYLSSNIGVKKSDGRLFNYINKKNARKKIIHFGDNIKSDYLVPKFYGIKSILLVSKKYQNTNYKIEALQEFINRNISNKKEYFKFGYRFLGPMIYGFCKYLDENIAKNKNIVFLAREGKFIKTCFEKISSKTSKYMYVSRKSVSSCLVNSTNISDKSLLIDLQSITQNETVENFLNRFELVTKENKEILSENNINLDDKYKKNKEVVKNIFSQLIINSKSNYNIFKEYMNSIIDNNTVLVDIGWSGTMQDILQLEIGNSYSLEGYYLGVRNKRKNIYKHGYWFDGEEDSSDEIISRSMVGFLEILFSADHGTTTGYSKVENEIIPNVSENDVNEEALKLIKEIQEGAYKFICDFKENKMKDFINFSRDEFLYNIKKVGTRPSNEIIKMFERIEVFDENVVNLVGNKNIIYYIFSPKRFVIEYLNSTWKNAFLKRIFKLNLNYYKFFNILYRMEKREKE